jgi:hypothetical protein
MHHKACFFKDVVMMPCRKGSMNYKNNLLINIVSAILPNGELGWQAVAHAYHEQLKEENVHDSSDPKKHWFKTLCRYCAMG